MARAVLGALAMAVLAGCTTVAERADPAALDPDLVWQLRGRLAVADDDQSWSGALFWRLERQSFLIEFSGPLGQGTVRLTEDAGGAELALSASERYRDRDTETLLRRHFGWSLPVAELRSWLTARPVPGGAHQVVHDQQGRVVELLQDGWQLRYDRYRAVSGISWPYRVRLDGKAYRARLVVDEWLPGPASAPHL